MDAKQALELVEKWMLFYYYDKETDEIERSQEAAEALAVLTAMVEENERLRVLTDLSHLADMLKELNEVKAELATRKEIMAEDFLEITRLRRICACRWG